MLIRNLFMNKHHEQAPTTVDYILRDGALYDKAGVTVDPALINPGFYVRDTNAPMGMQPPGTSNIWDDPQVSYCDEVEFIWPDTLRLKFPGETFSTGVVSGLARYPLPPPPPPADRRVGGGEHDRKRFKEYYEELYGRDTSAEGETISEGKVYPGRRKSGGGTRTGGGSR
jgi:hypothetical protein